MLTITCPQCAKQIGVPDDAAGKKVRCPLCQAVFQASGAAAPAAIPVAVPFPGPVPQPRKPPPLPVVPDSVQAELASVAPRNASDARRGRPESLDENGHDPTEIRRRARRKVRGAGIFLYLAIFLDFLIALVFIWNLFQAAEAHGGQTRNLIAGLVFLLVIWVPPVAFIFVGAGQLLALKRRGLVITGAVMAFVVSVLLIIGILLQAVVISEAVRRGINLPVFFYIQILLYILGFFANLFAGVMSLVAIARPAVKEAYFGYRPGMERERTRSRRMPPPGQGGMALFWILGSVLGGLVAIGVVVTIVLVSQPGCCPVPLMNS